MTLLLLLLLAEMQELAMAVGACSPATRYNRPAGVQPWLPQAPSHPPRPGSWQANVEERITSSWTVPVGKVEGPQHFSWRP